jgi:hypothetical protein
MSPAIKELLQHVASWPQEDQEELADVARDIEARRTGVYRATPEELKALDEADRSGIAGLADPSGADGGYISDERR